MAQRKNLILLVPWAMLKKLACSELNVRKNVKKGSGINYLLECNLKFNLHSPRNPAYVTEHSIDKIEDKMKFLSRMTNPSADKKTSHSPYCIDALSLFISWKVD